MTTKPKGKVAIVDMDRAARLLRALAEWSEIDKALAKKQIEDRPTGVELNVGSIEYDHGELVQPDAGMLVDRDTGMLIAAAAKKIIEDELRKMGVRL